MKDAPNIRIVLLSDFHHFGCLLPILLKLLLGCFDFCFLIADPLVELQILPLEGSWRDLVLVVHFVDVLESSLLSVRNCLLSNLEHFRVLFRIEVLRSQFTWTHELSERVPFKYGAARANLWVSLRPI